MPSRLRQITWPCNRCMSSRSILPRWWTRWSWCHPMKSSGFVMSFRLHLRPPLRSAIGWVSLWRILRHQIEFADSEIVRLRERKATYQRALGRIENYVIHTIEVLGKDAKGKYRRLEGKTVTFSLAGCPPSVEITDESAVPAEYRALTLKLPALVWEQILALLGAPPAGSNLRPVNLSRCFDRQAGNKSSDQRREDRTRCRPCNGQGIAPEGLRVKPWRDSKYLQWIRSLPCSVCRATRNIEAAHTGPHGLGQKSPDSTAIPLCTRHHRTGNDSYHRLGPRRFSQVHSLDIHGIVSDLNAKPMIRVISGKFIGSFKDELYVLGSTRADPAQAVQKMIRLRRMIQIESAQNPEQE